MLAPNLWHVRGIGSIVRLNLVLDTHREQVRGRPLFWATIMTQSFVRP